MLLRDIVEVSEKRCKGNFVYEYTLPCNINKDIVIFLEDIGKQKYPLTHIKLISIGDPPGATISGRLGTKSIKLTIPLNSSEVCNIINTFEHNLSDWVGETIGILIES